jgi:hypothetical protein
VEDDAGWQEAGRASASESGAGGETWFEKEQQQAGRLGLSAAPTAGIVARIVMGIGKGRRRSGLGGGWAGCGWWSCGTGRRDRLLGGGRGSQPHRERIVKSRDLTPQPLFGVFRAFSGHTPRSIHCFRSRKNCAGSVKGMVTVFNPSRTSGARLVTVH